MQGAVQKLNLIIKEIYIYIVLLLFFFFTKFQQRLQSSEIKDNSVYIFAQTHHMRIIYDRFLHKLALKSSRVS